MAKIGPQICTQDAMNTFIAALMSLWPEFWVDLIYDVSSLSTRAINAGKSALNEDQARCEVLVIKRKPGGNPTSSQIPMTRRRSSLPNGEGVDPPSCSVSETTPFNLSGSVARARWQPDASKWMYSPNKHVAHVQGVEFCLCKGCMWLSPVQLVLCDDTHMSTWSQGHSRARTSWLTTAVMLR